MPLDLKRLSIRHPSETVLEPREIFRALPQRSRKYQFPRDVQSEVWTRWFKRRSQQDSLLKLNTGSGKTVVGLVLLKSCLNEGVGPAVYIAPTPYLADQVAREAGELGVRVDQDPRSIAVSSGQAILVTTIKKLFNGRSQFGVGDEVKIEIGSIVIDDAHACLQETEEQFTLVVPRLNEAFASLFSMFRETLLSQSRTKVRDLEEGEPNTLMPIPFWAWQNNLPTITTVLHSFRTDDRAQFVWPLLKDVLAECRCVFGPAGAEISPRMIPVDLIPSFARARRRVFMGATFTDDSVLVSHFGAAPAALSAVITPDTANDIGDRMILVPQALNTELADEQLKEYLAHKAESVNVVVIVPSGYRAGFWRDVAAQTLTADSLTNGIEALRNGHVGLTVIVNRYDGMDLPDDACRILVIDGLPDVRRMIDKVDQNIQRATNVLGAEAIQRIEQGMGRGNRSADDWCVVFLMGRSLTAHLYRPQARDHFTAATRAQWLLSEEVAIQLRGKSLNEIDEAIDHCIQRDPEWVGASRGALVGLKYPSSSEIDPIVAARKEAFEAARRNDLVRAIDHARSAVNETEDQATRGWLLVEVAAYQHRLDPSQAQVTLRSAKGLNMQVTTPLDGVTYHRLAANLSNQAGSCLARLRERFKTGNELLVFANALTDDLRFVPDAAVAFESAFGELGNLIGFDSQRPEADYGRGPDVLWGMGSLQFCVVEAKNGVTTDRISKSDCNQLAGSVNWFREEYDQSCRATAIMVHRSELTEHDATAPPGGRCITTERLQGLVGAVRGFASAVASKPRFGSEQEVAQVLAEAGLSAATFVDRHSTAMRSAGRPRTAKRGAH
jgi:hypothetical protein